MRTRKMAAPTEAQLETQREVVRKIARSHENGTRHTVVSGHPMPGGLLEELTEVIAICDGLEPRQAREVLSAAMTRYEG